MCDVLVHREQALSAAALWPLGLITVPLEGLSWCPPTPVLVMKMTLDIATLLWEAVVPEWGLLSYSLLRT
jgi:hypothetical protein